MKCHYKNAVPCAFDLTELIKEFPLIEKVIWCDNGIEVYIKDQGLLLMKVGQVLVQEHDGVLSVYDYETFHSKFQVVGE